MVKTDKVSQPPKLFCQSTLQIAASKRFGYTAKRVLEIAQSLYDSDKRLTTYPRTDSQYLTDEQKESTLAVIDTILSSIPDLNSGIAFTPNIKRCINAKKVGEHHAIIPTAEIANYDISSLKEDERNVLFLICERLLLAAAPPHKYEETKVTLDCSGHEFKTSGKVVIEDGYKALERFFNSKSKSKVKAKESKTSEAAAKLPPIREGNTFRVAGAAKKEHWTTPPQHYTDGTLVEKMCSIGKTGIIDAKSREEIRGIGTEATRADIIEEIIKGGFVGRSKQYLLSTEKGQKLISVLPDEIKSPQMTANWEAKLYDIEKGKSDADNQTA